MEENQKKEILSENFVSLLGIKGGFKCQKITHDNGVDLHVIRVAHNNYSGDTRCFDDPRTLLFQLKATTNKEITRGKDFIKYDLRIKNYNDLVYSRILENGVPIILVLCILPDSEESWFKLSDNSLSIFSEAYYYIADSNAEIDNNLSTKRIEIKTANRFDFNSMEKLHKEIYRL